MSVRVEHGACLQVVPQLVAEGMLCDAVVTDPPYHLAPLHNRFANSARTEATIGNGVFGRHAAGFMGQKWDGGDIAFRPETWATIATALRPGAFLVAFGGTRTYHRLTCAIEDGGFVIQDCIMWLFATGFPKRRDMLKPAYEPIVLAYKPGAARTMQIDECRIGTSKNVPSTPRRAAQGCAYGDLSNASGDTSGFDANVGRWPANVCHDGSDEVLAAFPESAGQSGNLTGSEPSSKHARVWQGGMGRTSFAARNDSGSAARFFFSAKAGAEDRWGSRHPTVKPVKLMKWLVALVCPPDGVVLDPFAGSGTTGVAALAAGRDAILIEREPQYCADIEARLAHYRGDGAHSAAVKNRSRQQPPIGGLFTSEVA